MFLQSVLKWLTSDKAVNVPGKIIEVNDLMLGKMMAVAGEMNTWLTRGKHVVERY